MNETTLSNILNGVDNSLVDAAKDTLKASIQHVSDGLESSKQNRVSRNRYKANNQQKKIVGGPITDAELYTNLSNMINGDNADVGGFQSLLESLYAKNKKGFAIIKDYELMPILIPQINRVIMFLVNECLSPDIQNVSTFQIRFTGQDDPDRIQADIDSIKKEMKLDNMLREVYMNRYKLGREYYRVTDYNETFQHMLDVMDQKQLNEATSKMSDNDYLDHLYESLNETIDEIGFDIRIQQLEEIDPTAKAKQDSYMRDIIENVIHLDFHDLNIQIERSSLCEQVKTARAEILSENYRNFKPSELIKRMNSNQPLNEAVVLDNEKLRSLTQQLRDKRLHRCTIDRMDPAKVFPLKVGGHRIGYLYTTDINEGTRNLVNFAQALKDQLLKSRATNMSSAIANAEEIISKQLAEKIINRFDPNIGINQVEDIDLLHDYIRNNEIFRGNKRVTFYYEDEVFDLSRSDDSILINSVFFTKLYATLLLNNIMTKVLRGRGRQIHTVRMGASPDVQRYIQNAMASLTMPENNLGTLHGSFEQILNPFNAASDIVIPTEDDTDRYITTDYIPGQDVDMNDDFLRSLLNSIVSSFGLDSAVIDATNGNLQFARTLTMESLQISNMVMNEQQDLYDNWSAMCLAVLRIMGSDKTKQAVDQGLVKVQFYEPKSLILQNTIDEINNSKSYADAIADIIPEFNQDGSERRRTQFVYNEVKKKTNLDWKEIERSLEEVRIMIPKDQLEDEIQKIIMEYMENAKDVIFGDNNGNGVRGPNDEISPEEQEYGEYADMGGSDEGGLTQEEQELMNSPDEEL